MGLGDALAQHRVPGGSIFPGNPDDFIEFGLKQHLLAQGGDPALKTQQTHGDPPAIPRLPDDVLSRTHGPIKKYLIELGGTGQLLDGADSDPRLGHGQQEKAQPPVALVLGIGARQHEDVVRLVGQGGPYFLAGDAPFLATGIKLSPGPDGREIRASTRLGIALTPKIRTGANTR